MSPAPALHQSSKRELWHLLFPATPDATHPVLPSLADIPPLPGFAQVRQKGLHHMKQQKTYSRCCFDVDEGERLVCIGLEPERHPACSTQRAETVPLAAHSAQCRMSCMVRSYPRHCCLLASVELPASHAH